jgi:hypothetical protein
VAVPAARQGRVVLYAAGHDMQIFYQEQNAFRVEMLFAGKSAVLGRKCIRLGRFLIQVYVVICSIAYYVGIRYASRIFLADLPVRIYRARQGLYEGFIIAVIGKRYEVITG